MRAYFESTKHKEQNGTRNSAFFSSLINSIHHKLSEYFHIMHTNVEENGHPIIREIDV